MFPVEFPDGAPVLVAGAGGGFDFLCGLPVALDLERRGHPVVLASYSFTDVAAVERAGPGLEGVVEATADSRIPGSDYFPEAHLASWYRERRGEERSIWCLPRLGVRPTLAAYGRLAGRFGIAAIAVVDGGIDGIFRGDEHDLGTPSMDSISVVACSLAPVAHRLYVATAFGVEGAEGEVSHAQALRRMAELTARGAFLGAGALLASSPTGSEFLDAVRHVFARMSPVRRSVIVSALRAALEGRFGRVDVHPKTEIRQPWVSPLTALYWCFEAGAVARMKTFHDQIVSSETVEEVARAIEAARARTGVEPPESIPI